MKMLPGPAYVAALLLLLGLDAAAASAGATHGEEQTAAAAQERLRPDHCKLGLIHGLQLLSHLPAACFQSCNNCQLILEAHRLEWRTLCVEVAGSKTQLY